MLIRRVFHQMILDVEPEDDEDDEDEEEEDEEDISGDGRDGLAGRHERRHHSRIASDLSVIESSAEMLYGLIHQRYICSRAGIQQMSEKYELSHFGYAPGRTATRRERCQLASRIRLVRTRSSSSAHRVSTSMYP